MYLDWSGVRIDDNYKKSRVFGDAIETLTDNLLISQPVSKAHSIQKPHYHHYLSIVFFVLSWSVCRTWTDVQHTVCSNFRLNINTGSLLTCDLLETCYYKSLYLSCVISVQCGI